MHCKPRILAGLLERMVQRFPPAIVCGARQVGKTTLVRHVVGDLGSPVFDPAADVGNARGDPDLFPDNHPAPVVRDEIGSSLPRDCR